MTDEVKKIINKLTIEDIKEMNKVDNPNTIMHNLLMCVMILTDFPPTWE